MANFSVTTRDITQIITEIKQCELQIPNFQRDFVWTHNQIKALLDSIRKGIPLGAIITWDVPTAYTKHFEQYLSEATQTQGGWLVLDDTKMLKQSSWFADIIAGTKANPLPAITNVKSNNFEGIIDGRQRTQSLLFAFGGMCYGYNPHKYAKIWYLDLNKDIEDDENPFNFVKVNEVKYEKNGGGKFDSIGKWIDKGFYPLWWTNESDYQAEMAHPPHYTSGAIPINLKQRMTNLSKWTKILSGTNIAKITLNNTVDLSMVCEVFETLNEAGTKVTAFEIVHATLIGNSPKGSVNLKARLEGYRNENVDGFNPGLKAWTKKQANWKSLAQGITLAYCLSADIQKKFPSSKKIFTSVKGDAMIATPPEFYAELLDIDFLTGMNVAGFPFHKLLENICMDFHEITRGNAGPSSRWCPTPILFSFYLSLRLKLHYSPIKKYSEKSLNDAFRAYYWRAVSTSLYDQGYLTMIYAHTKKVGEFLEQNETDYANSPNVWWNNYQKEIEAFTTPVLIPIKSELIDSFTDPKVAGTMKNMLMQSLFIFAPIDIKGGQKIYGLDEEDVELHHIFPQNWITNNITNKDLKEKRKCIAVLVPMKKKPNIEWKAKDPKVALNNWHKGSKTTLRPFYDSLGIPTHNDTCHDCLNDDTITSEKRLEDFINERAKYLAEKIIMLSECQVLSGFPAW